MAPRVSTCQYLLSEWTGGDHLDWESLKMLNAGKRKSDSNWGATDAFGAGRGPDKDCSVSSQHLLSHPDFFPRSQLSGI